MHEKKPYQSYVSLPDLKNKIKIHNYISVLQRKQQQSNRGLRGRRNILKYIMHTLIYFNIKFYINCHKHFCHFPYFYMDID